MPSQIKGKYLRYILHFRTKFKSCLRSETHHRGEIVLAALGHTAYRALGCGEFPYLRLIRCDHENTAKAQTSLNRRFCLGAKNRERYRRRRNCQKLTNKHVLSPPRRYGCCRKRAAKRTRR